VVIPCVKRNDPVSRRDFVKGFFAPWRMPERALWRSSLRRQPPTRSGAGDGNRTHTAGASEPIEQAVWCDGGCQV
jgi:hypothetical protein